MDGTLSRMAEQNGHNAHEFLGKVRRILRLDKLPKPVQKIITGIIGSIFLVAGVVMIVTPGPAFIFIPLGLLILASEFKWAERWAQKAQGALHNGREKWRERKRRRAASAKS